MTSGKKVNVLRIRLDDKTLSRFDAARHHEDGGAFDGDEAKRGVFGRKLLKWALEQVEEAGSLHALMAKRGKR